MKHLFHYERFVTRIKFLLQRVCQRASSGMEESELAEADAEKISERI